MARGKAPAPRAQFYSPPSWRVKLNAGPLLSCGGCSCLGGAQCENPTAVRIRTITIECRDPYPLVAFWTKVTEYQEDPGNPNEPGDPEGLLVAPGGSLRLLFIKVPEPVREASRFRLDLTPAERSRDEEVDRLLKMGATLVDDHREPSGDGWVVLADPEGNEFSVGRRAVEDGPAAEQAVPLLTDPVAPGAEKGSEGWQARLVACDRSQARGTRAIATAAAPVLT